MQILVVEVTILTVRGNGGAFIQCTNLTHIWSR